METCFFAPAFSGDHGYGHSLDGRGAPLSDTIPLPTASSHGAFASGMSGTDTTSRLH